MANTWKIIDATDMILGRFCSKVAKIGLSGEKIVIINAQKAIMSGNRNTLLKKYVDLMEVRTRTNPRQGPFHNSRPDTFLRQRIRFMLPKNSRGKKTYENIHVYINGIPKSKETRYGKTEELKVNDADKNRLSCNYITIADICYQIGWAGKSRGLSA